MDSSDPVYSSDYFVTDNIDTYFDGDNPHAEDFKIHRITSKFSNTNTAYTTEERNNADNIRAQMETGANLSCTHLNYILHN